MTVRETVLGAFRDRFGGEPGALARAPGRVNLIGEHTDYNDGYVLPLAIDRAVWLALRARDDRRVVVHSLSYGETAAFDLEGLRLRPGGEVGGTVGAWVEYLKGVAALLQEFGRRLKGFDAVIGGNVPVGAGLSSSAAVELATAQAFAAVNRLAWRPADAARLGQRVENEWIGVRSGIMDQTVIASGREGHALLIDCRWRRLTLVPLPVQDAVVVVLDTGTRRGVADSAYNERRAQCDVAAKHFGVSALRDLDINVLQSRGGGLDPVPLRRARHVVTENARTLAAVDALQAGDVGLVGRLMNESHASLRDDYEVTNAQLDTMVELAQDQPGCLGARMTGAGFGGCAVALVRPAEATRFLEEVPAAYHRATGVEPQGYLCQAADGASVELLAPPQVAA